MDTEKMKIAILALQGAFLEHQQMFARLGVETTLIRNLDDWNSFAAPASAALSAANRRWRGRGLVIPGGESTAMLRIMCDEGLLEPLRSAIAGGLPVFGTCAGMILLAKVVCGDSPEQTEQEKQRRRIATMDISVRRNAYGRQLGSFYTEAHFAELGPVPMTFIRAPYIEEVCSDEVEVLATVDGHIVAARQGHQLVTSFHPELNDDTRIHEYFIKMIEASHRP